MTSLAVLMLLVGACAATDFLYSSKDDVAEADLPAGHWTEVFNLDQPKNFGEFESAKNEIMRANLANMPIDICQIPIAIKVWPTDHSIDVHRQVECGVDIRLDPAKGYKCYNRYQYADEYTAARPPSCLAECVSLGLGEGCVSCPDVEVSFYCPENTKRSQGDDDEEKELDEEIEELLDDIKWQQEDMESTVKRLQQKRAQEARQDKREKLGRKTELAKLVLRIMEELKEEK